MARSLLSVIQNAMENLVVFNLKGPGKLHASLALGDTESRALLILGDNATGKSLARNAITRQLSHPPGKSKDKVERLEVSMRTRTAGGFASMMYSPFGDEQDSSGAVSISPLEGLFNTASKREAPVVISLDEMEVSLGESYQYALGQTLAAEHLKLLASKPENLYRGLIVVSHSRELVSGFLDTLGHTPHSLMMGEGAPENAREWTTRPVVRRTVEELVDLPGASIEKHRAILQELNALKGG